MIVPRIDAESVKCINKNWVLLRSVLGSLGHIVTELLLIVFHNPLEAPSSAPQDLYSF